jgi:hypothetical protein
VQLIHSIINFKNLRCLLVKSLGQSLDLSKSGLVTMFKTTVAGDAYSEPDAGAVHGQPHHLEAARGGAQDGEGGEEREGGVGEKHQV